jgi:hypothetical protein
MTSTLEPASDHAYSDAETASGSHVVLISKIVQLEALHASASLDRWTRPAGAAI